MGKCWLVVPALVMLLAVGMRFGLMKFTKFDAQAPALRALSEEELSRRAAGSSSLCVGCTAGIGAGVAMELCKRGGTVVVVGRRKPEALLAGCPQNLEWRSADLSSMKTAQALARELAPRKFHNVLFTQDYISPPEKLLRSEEGVEMNTAVYFLSRVVMLRELLSAGLGSNGEQKPRVFSMAFPGVPDEPQVDDFNWEQDKSEWASWKAHKNSVVSQDAVVLALAKRHPEVNFFGLNPGIIKTDLLQDFLGGGSSPKFVMQQLVIGTIARSVEDYSLNTGVQMLLTPEIEEFSATFYNHLRERIKPSKWLTDSSSVDERSERIWEEAIKLADRSLAA